MISLSNFTHNDIKQYRRQLTQWAGVRYLPGGSWSRVMTLSLLVANILGLKVFTKASNLPFLSLLRVDEVVVLLLHIRRELSIYDDA